MSKKDHKQISAWIPPELWDKLQEAKEVYGTPYNESVCRALELYFKQPEVGLYLKHGERDANL